MEEQVSVLACYEVYMYTGDLKEFLDSLFSIEKVEFFKNEANFFADIENFNDVIELQLKIIYSFKNYLSNETRATLEKIIRTGNNSVMTIYQEFKINKNKNEVIHKLVNFAEENYDIIKEYEKLMYENKMINERKHNKRKETIESFEETKLVKEISHMELVYELIDVDHELVHSIFEVFEYTKDKMDFIENLKIVYDFTFRKKIMALLTSKPEKYNFTEDEIEYFESLLIKRESNIYAAFEFYLVGKDDEEFFETAQLILKLQKKNKNKN